MVRRSSPLPHFVPVVAKVISCGVGLFSDILHLSVMCSWLTLLAQGSSRSAVPKLLVSFRSSMLLCNLYSLPQSVTSWESAQKTEKQPCEDSNREPKVPTSIPTTQERKEDLARNETFEERFVLGQIQQKQFTPSTVNRILLFCPHHPTICLDFFLFVFEGIFPQSH